MVARDGGAHCCGCEMVFLMGLMGEDSWGVEVLGIVWHVIIESVSQSIHGMRRQRCKFSVTIEVLSDRTTFPDA